MRIEIVGSYKIGNDPWRLIEMRLFDAPQDFDFGSIALPVSDRSPDHWQAPYDERILATDEVAGVQHVCFFLYVLNDGALTTPVGELPVPPSTERPKHLAHIVFEEP